MVFHNAKHNRKQLCTLQHLRTAPPGRHHETAAAGTGMGGSAIPHPDVTNRANRTTREENTQADVELARKCKKSG